MAVATVGAAVAGALGPSVAGATGARGGVAAESAESSRVPIEVTELVDQGQGGEALDTAWQINERGQVIGATDDPTAGVGRGGAIWHRGQITRLAPGRWTIPVDISERGQVVGNDVMGYQGPIVFPLPRAFTWSDGRWTMFDPECVSAAMAVNDRGQVVGHRSSGPGQCPPEVVVWHGDGGADDGDGDGDGGEEVPPLDYETNSHISTEMDINDRGQILVASRPWAEGTVTDSTVSLVWQPGREPAEVGTLGGLPSHGLDLNERGQVAGWSQTASGQQHAFLWQPGRSRGVMTDLGTLGGDTSRPGAGGAPADIGVPMSPPRPTRVLNERGHVVGTSETASGEQHAFLWRRGGSRGEMIDLGTLGGPTSAALAVNDRDQVVGYSTTASGATHAFLWQRGEMTDLGALAEDEDQDQDGPSVAVDINDRGQIVGMVADDAYSGGVLWTVRH